MAWSTLSSPGSRTSSSCQVRLQVNVDGLAGPMHAEHNASVLAVWGVKCRQVTALCEHLL
jgi:hypothetical protein